MAITAKKKNFKCSILTIGKNMIKSMNINRIDVPISSGLISIYKDHAPYISDIHFGKLMIYDENNNVINMYIEDGIVEVSKNTVSVLVKKAYYFDDLDLEEIKSKLETVSSQTFTAIEDIHRRDRNIHRLNFQLKLAEEIKNNL